jgi:putative transposase
MSRPHRLVVPNYPHHVVQRGARRERLFFLEEDYGAYLSLLSRMCRKFNVEIWAYCLMSNHTHFMAVPKDARSLSLVFKAANHAYSLRINERQGWKGHLWQGRFASFPMDNEYMIAAARYIEHNPVAAGMVQQPEDYPWSSARAHFAGKDDVLVKVAPLLEIFPRWEDLVHSSLHTAQQEVIRKHERNSRPLGGKAFIGRLEDQLGKTLVDPWEKALPIAY